MIPPKTRRQISDTYSTVTDYAKSSFWFGAKGAYAISVSVLFVSVPFVYLLVEDMQMAEQEKEIRMREMGNEVSKDLLIQLTTPKKFRCDDEIG
jgi:hypothetical protein